MLRPFLLSRTNFFVPTLRWVSVKAGKRLMIGRKEPGNGVCLTTDLKSNYQITVGVGHKPALIEAINDTKDVLREGDIDSFNLIFDRKRSDSFQEQVLKIVFASRPTDWCNRFAFEIKISLKHFYWIERNIVSLLFICYFRQRLILN